MSKGIKAAAAMNSPAAARVAVAIGGELTPP
jgi:hypothetical protein